MFAINYSLKFFKDFIIIFLYSTKSYQYRERKRLTAPFTAGISFYGLSLFLWSFHRWYIVMGNTFYIVFAIIPLEMQQSNC